MAEPRAGLCPDSWRRCFAALAMGCIAIAALSPRALGDQPAVVAEIGPDSAAPGRLEHVFGGRSVGVPLVLYGASAARADVKVRLLQRAPGLAAPVGGDTDVASGVDFSAGLRRELTFDVAIPAVERESRFDLVVFLRAHPGGPWRQAASLSLRAYPNDLLKPLKRWAERRSLRVRDPAGKLESFLTAQGIPFLDLNARSLEKSDDPSITLLVGADGLAAARARARRGEAVVFFGERTVAFPRIERVRWPGGSLLIVELPLLDRLAVDPQAQKLFLQIVESAQLADTGKEEDLWHERQDLQ
jgi:hypothetical protein